MGENMNKKKITLASLMAKAEQSKKNKLKVKEVYVASLEGTLALKSLKEDLCFSIIDKIGNTKEMSLVMESYDEMIYHSCDLLHDVELVKAYGVSEATELPKMIFTITERTKLGEAILEISGFKDLDEKVKN